MKRRSAPAVARNRDPILQVLRDWLPAQGRVLEIAAGTGEHAVHFAAALPDLSWTPTDPSPDGLESIAAWREAEGTANLLEPRFADAADPSTWPDGPVAAVVCINMVHISPWRATEGLLAGAAGRLPPGGPLVLYGPYLEDGVATAPSNLAFDADLKARDPAWGLRRLEDVAALAGRAGLELAERRALPANNIAVLFRRR